jgi:hypothetical protein
MLSRGQKTPDHEAATAPACCSHSRPSALRDLRKTEKPPAARCARSGTFSSPCLILVRMALYRVHFLDFGDNVLATHLIEHEDDDAAVSAAHSLNVLPHISAGFEVWDDERLVHAHRN